MTQSLTFTVTGAVPAPQGSKTARPVYRNGEFTGRVNQVESSAALHAWRDRVAIFARRARRTTPSIGGPVEVAATFHMPRPRKQVGVNGVKDPYVDAMPAVRPDVDKLLRAVLDALTMAKVYHDDAQVVTVVGRKVFATETGPGPGVDVTVRAYTPPPTNTGADRRGARPTASDPS